MLSTCVWHASYIARAPTLTLDTCSLYRLLAVKQTKMQWICRALNIHWAFIEPSCEMHALCKIRKMQYSPCSGIVPTWIYMVSPCMLNDCACTFDALTRYVSIMQRHCIRFSMDATSDKHKRHMMYTCIWCLFSLHSPRAPHSCSNLQCLRHACYALRMCPLCTQHYFTCLHDTKKTPGAWSMLCMHSTCVQYVW